MKPILPLAGEDFGCRVRKGNHAAIFNPARLAIEKVRGVEKAPDLTDGLPSVRAWGILPSAAPDDDWRAALVFLWWGCPRVLRL